MCAWLGVGFSLGRSESYSLEKNINFRYMCTWVYIFLCFRVLKDDSLEISIEFDHAVYLYVALPQLNTSFKDKDLNAKYQ